MNTLQQPQFIPHQFLEQNSTQRLGHQQPSKFKNLHKIITITTILAVFLSYRLLYSQIQQKNCITDNTHEWTFTLNRWIALNFARPFIGLGQVVMDVNVTCILIYWIVYVKTFRVLLVAAFFQYSRQFMLKIMTMPFESYTVWQSPGFPTWTVAYDHTSDYFFSGHTGTLVILYLEVKNLNLPKIVQYYFILCIIYIIFMLLVARVHYTSDVVAGFLFAGFFYEFTDRHLSFFDMIVNSPYKIFMILKEKVQKELQKNADQGTSLFDIQHEGVKTHQ